MSEEIIRVKSDKDGQVKILKGMDFHTLTREKITVFETDDICAFLDYVKEFEEYSIYYDESSCVAVYDTEQENENMIAKCSLSNSPSLSKLLNNVNIDMSIDQMESFLRYMRPFVCDNGRDLLSNVSDFKMEKVVKVKRKKDQKGNLSYTFSCEDSGNETFNPPEKITCSIPIFQFIESECNFEFELEFGYKMRDDNAVFTFNLINLRFKEELMKARKEIFEEVLRETDVKKYWGNVKTKEYTDAWKYKSNPTR